MQGIGCKALLYLLWPLSTGHNAVENLGFWPFLSLKHEGQIYLPRPRESHLILKSET